MSVQILTASLVLLVNELNAAALAFDRVALAEQNANAAGGSAATTLGAVSSGADKAAASLNGVAPAGQSAAAAMGAVSSQGDSATASLNGVAAAGSSASGALGSVSTAFQTTASAAKEAADPFKAFQDLLDKFGPTATIFKAQFDDLMQKLKDGKEPMYQLREEFEKLFSEIAGSGLKGSGVELQNLIQQLQQLFAALSKGGRH